VYRKEYGWSVRLVYDPRELTGVTTARPGVAGVLQPRYPPSSPQSSTLRCRI
jgi:hypothetical protein